MPTSNVLSVIENQYHARRALYEDFAYLLYKLLDGLIKEANIPISKIEYRTKSIESLLEKIKRKHYDDPFTQIKDIVGIRVITYYQGDIEKVTNLIRQQFDIDERTSINPASYLGVTDFGYSSIHFIISPSPYRAVLEEWKPFAGLFAEIQIRSAITDIWTGFASELDYGVPISAPPEFRENFFKATTLLNQADEIFTSLRSQKEEILEKYREETIAGYTTDIIDFTIDGKWSDNDLITFCTAIRNLYQVYLTQIEKKSTTEILRIRQLKYASPGNISFRGLGEPIKELKNLIESLALLILKWKKEKVELELKKKEVQAKDLELKQKELQIQQETEESKINLEKAKIENRIELEKKVLELVEKRIEVMKKLEPGKQQIDELIDPLKQNLLSITPLIQDEKLMLPEIEGV